MSETDYAVSSEFIELVTLFIEPFLGLCWRAVSDGLKQATVVEPVDPFQGFPLDRISGFPRAQAMDDLGFELADDRFRQGIVPAVTNAADRGFDPGLGQALGIADRHVLTASIAVMNEVAIGPPLTERLFQSIEHELGLRGS